MRKQRSPRSWTDEEINLIVFLRELEHLSFSEIAEHPMIHDSMINVIGVYRREKGVKHGKYSDIEGDGTRKTFKQSGNSCDVKCSSPRIMTEEELITLFGIDTSIWVIDSFECKTQEAYRKDKQVDWEIDSSGARGKVHDSGKLLVVPLYHVSAKFHKNIPQSRAIDSISDMLEDIQEFSPEYPKINYQPTTDGLLGEIDLFDVHFGRLTWEEESGLNYDIKIAEEAIHEVIDKLLSNMGKFNINKILFPIGNDFFNVDNKFNTTTHGTPQQEDTRYQKTFRAGRRILVEVIDKCSEIAPVDILIVPGNHDEQRSFYLGEALSAWYRNSPNVTVNNNAYLRKYYLYGTTLLGFTHGYSEKLRKLPLIMALEVPELWAKAKYREIHTGDKHHKEDMVMKSDESEGVNIRILRALAAKDAWTVNSGFIGAVPASESFLWHPTDGLIAQFTASPMCYMN